MLCTNNLHLTASDWYTSFWKVYNRASFLKTFLSTTTRLKSSAELEKAVLVSFSKHHFVVLRCSIREGIILMVVIFMIFCA